jgi:tetratricopeptide (TPR) repeat protein
MIAVLLTLMLATAPETGLIRPPEWARRALEHSTGPIIHRLTAPTPVAGVRGNEARPEDLYWKTRQAGVEGTLVEAERAETDGRFPEAHRLFNRVLAGGATGRAALRARIGTARCELAEGRAEAAARRLRLILASSSDPDLRYAAAIPAAIAEATAGRRDEAIALLKETLLSAPDHPLAGRADAVLWIISEK